MIYFCQTFSKTNFVIGTNDGIKADLFGVYSFGQCLLPLLVSKSMSSLVACLEEYILIIVCFRCLLSLLCAAGQSYNIVSDYIRIMCPFWNKEYILIFVCFGCWLSLLCALANLIIQPQTISESCGPCTQFYNVQALRIPSFDIYWLLFVFVVCPVCSCLPLSERLVTGKHYTYSLTTLDSCVCSFPCR